jgi:hypothetical protein
MLAGVLALLPACGDDDGGGGGGGTTRTNQDILETGMQGLAEFGQDAVSLQETEIVFGLAQTLPQVFPKVGKMAAPVLLAPSAADAAKAIVSLAPRLVQSPQGMTAAGIEEAYGVYVCDPDADPVEPFPGWVKIEEDPSPSNSVILRFDTDCGITYHTPRGIEKTATGEIRLLDLQLFTGDPANPEDDVPTFFIAEIAAGPAGTQPRMQPTVVRVTWEAEVDEETGQLTHLAIGSPEANSPLHRDASFFGPLLFPAVVAPTEGGLDATFGLYDTIHNYALTFGAGIVGTLDVLESLSLGFGFGETDDPADPPFRFDVTASEFESSGGDLPLATIEGSISYRDSDLALFEGSTEFIQLEEDVNGDGVVDANDVCPNVDVTFTDTEETGNVCLYMEELVMLITSLMGPLTTTAAH